MGGPLGSGSPRRWVVLCKRQSASLVCDEAPHCLMLRVRLGSTQPTRVGCLTMQPYSRSFLSTLSTLYRIRAAVPRTTYGLKSGHCRAPRCTACVEAQKKLRSACERILLLHLGPRWHKSWITSILRIRFTLYIYLQISDVTYMCRFVFFADCGRAVLCFPGFHVLEVWRVNLLIY